MILFIRGVSSRVIRVPFSLTDEERKLLTREKADEMRAKITQELLEAHKKIRDEAQPDGSDIWTNVFADDEVKS